MRRNAKKRLTWQFFQGSEPPTLAILQDEAISHFFVYLIHTHGQFVACEARGRRNLTYGGGGTKNDGPDPLLTAKSPLGAHITVPHAVGAHGR